MQICENLLISSDNIYLTSMAFYAIVNSKKEVAIVMPYREIDLATKLEVVKEYWRRQKVAPVARHYRVSRDSVYEWINMAEVGISEALRSEKDISKPTNLVRRLEEENKALRDELQEVQETNIVLSQTSHLKVSLKSGEHEIRPGQCLKCKSEQIWKNGKYEVTDRKRKDIIKGTDLVQRFICKRCGTRIYLGKKRAL